MGCGFRVSGFGFWVSGFWFLVSGFWFLVSGFWFLVPGFGLRAPKTEDETRNPKLSGVWFTSGLSAGAPCHASPEWSTAAAQALRPAFGIGLWGVWCGVWGLGFGVEG